MDQDSFRSLLQKGPGDRPSNTSRGSLATVSANSKSKTIDASKPAFKPRKVKSEAEGKYRDRATERRTGLAHDFAHVEAVLEEFEKQANEGVDQADIEEKRKYLGGDSEHSVLVKGLDFALLEQNKARALLVSDNVDDESLEQAFKEVQPSTSKPKKRTREDLLRELKEKRATPTTAEESNSKTPEDEARALEEAKQKGKFKPIGFKPIGESGDGKKKKKVKSDKADVNRKKKKRKVEEDSNNQQVAPPQANIVFPPPAAAAHAQKEEQTLDEGFDIFAGAGDYDGLEFDDDEDDGGAQREERSPEPEESSGPRKWVFPDDDDVLSSKPSEQTHQKSLDAELPSVLAPPIREDEHDEMDEDDRPMRLVPLSSSVIPDVKELLAMDKASSSWNKNRKKKDKKNATAPSGGESKLTTEAKVERDYQKLKAYTDKKKS
ncbi:hypothetical protein FA15DRAFT_663864 [Coprinopsis marcescibilis]|uniref:RED-like N-terminal domain-containing protein n=1 Tax=Coprinopsis marcescibilis TaxID=230819 RepID=A0A5C3LA30_COPMA|nr:hypothetical protein FA15DRAFT_663864 [Coprinopsis marcescibilis]